MKITYIVKRLLPLSFLFLTASLSAIVGIDQQLISIENQLPPISPVLQATQTTLDAIQVNVQATLTTMENLIVETAAIIPSMTFANSIKLDTQETITIDQTILEILGATISAQESIFPLLEPTLETAQEIIFDAQQTHTTGQAIYIAAVNAMNSANTLYTDVHASRTVAESIYVDTQSILATDTVILTQLNATQTTMTSIQADVTSMLATSSNVATQITSANTSSSFILSRTQVLTVPITGGTITSPGTYVLTTDVSGQIVIASDNVYLSLNGHTVTNNSGDCIVINDGHNNVYVVGGNLVGSSATSSFSCVKVGNSVGGCSNVTIEMLRLSFQGTGINMLDNTSNTLIRGILTRNCNQGVSAPNTSLLRVRASQFRFDTANASTTSVGIVASTPSLTEVGGIGIYDCTIAGFVTGISISQASDTIITRCLIGDKSNNLGASEAGGIKLDSCTQSTVSYNTIHNISFQNAASKTNWGIYCVDCLSALLYYNNFNDIDNNGGAGSVAYGILISNSQGIMVSNAVMIGLGGTCRCIELDSSSQCIIRDSQVDGLGGTGNFCYEWDATGTNNIFTRNLAINFTPNTGFSGSIANVSTSTAGTDLMYNYQFA